MSTVIFLKDVSLKNPGPTPVARFEFESHQRTQAILQELHHDTKLQSIVVAFKITGNVTYQSMQSKC